MSEFTDKYKVKESIFEKGGKSYPTINIPIWEDKQGKVNYFSFGLTKAKRLLEYIDAIEDWVVKTDKIKEQIKTEDPF